MALAAEQPEPRQERRYTATDRPNEDAQAFEGLSPYETLYEQHRDTNVRLDRLEARLEHFAGRLDDGDVAEPRPSPGSHNDDVSQLRLRLSSLAGELVRAQEQIQEMGGSRVRVRRRNRKSRSQHRSRWAFWRRLIRL